MSAGAVRVFPPRPLRRTAPVRDLRLERLECELGRLRAALWQVLEALEVGDQAGAVEFALAVLEDDVGART